MTDTPHRTTCDASMLIPGTNGRDLSAGPCILRAGHDGPVHKAANGAQWWPNPSASDGDRLDTIAELQRQVSARDKQLAAVRALAADMRTWCSPHGIAVDYAQRIDEALDRPTP